MQHVHLPTGFADRPTQRRPHGWRALGVFTVVMGLAPLAACGGVGDGAERTVGIGAAEQVASMPADVAAPPAQPPVTAAPSPENPGPSDPAPSGSTPAGFEGVFGAPTGRLPGAPAPAPEPAPEPEPAPAPETTKPAPSTTPAPKEPVTTEPATTEPVTTEPSAPAGSPLPGVAPDVESFVAGWDAVNEALASDSLPRLRIDPTSVRAGTAVALDGATAVVAGDPIDLGHIGWLVDERGVAAVSLTGNPASDEFLSAIVTTIVALGAEGEIEPVAIAYDEVVSAGDALRTMPAADGGHWVFDASDGIVTLTKIQDADAASAENIALLLKLDLVLLLG